MDPRNIEEENWKNTDEENWENTDEENWKRLNAIGIFPGSEGALYTTDSDSEEEFPISTSESRFKETSKEIQEGQPNEIQYEESSKDTKETTENEGNLKRITKDGLPITIDSQGNQSISNFIEVMRKTRSTPSSKEDRDRLLSQFKAAPDKAKFITEYIEALEKEKSSKKWKPLAKKETSKQEDPLPMPDEHLTDQLSDPNFSQVIAKKESVKISKEDITKVVKKIADLKDIGFHAAWLGTSELFRRGGANAGASNIMSVEVFCPEKGKRCYIAKLKVSKSLEMVTGIRNIRKLAEAMAPDILQTNLKKFSNKTGEDLKGDLATKMNKKLISKGHEPLTDFEAICACTYAQWIPNLNTYACSGRLKALLEDDLDSKQKSLPKKNQTKSSNKKVTKGPTQPAKGRKGKKNMANNQPQSKNQMPKNKNK